MAYRVKITPPAKRRLDNYIGYTAVVLKNRQAASSIMEDARQTRERLANNASFVKVCENPVLAKYGYRKFHFQKHSFIMIYRICGDEVIVDGMYHELQDYEALFIDEMKLS